MPWMSINQFKRRFLLGKCLEGKMPQYEIFFHRETEAGTLTLDNKKRYIRILISPAGAAVLLSRQDATELGKAVMTCVEAGKPPAGSVKKDENGLKVYGDFKDGQGVRVIVREADSKHVFIEVPGGIPHLRARDSLDLVAALRTFSKKPL